jgi:hypothetical protein
MATSIALRVRSSLARLARFARIFQLGEEVRPTGDAGDVAGEVPERPFATPLEPMAWHGSLHVASRYLPENGRLAPALQRGSRTQRDRLQTPDQASESVSGTRPALIDTPWK